MAKAKRFKTDSYIGRKKASGYPAQPGSGPEKETCKTCCYVIALNPGRRTFRKCFMHRSKWTNSARTDIVLKSPACALWKAKEPTGGKP
jgi:hypothetical protein